MRAALSARVSTSRQALAQTITDQVTRLREHIRQQGWTLDATHVFRDDGYSGASLTRPGLDALRDQAALAAFDVVVLTAPDRLARKYIHQVLLLEELAGLGCQVLFVDRPMSQGPHDQLLLQIRGAVAEYERTLITERMRRGRQAKIRAGQLLPWTRPPFGYRADPERPRAAAALEIDPVAAVVVRQVFAWYLEPQATLYGVAARLTASVIATPDGRPCWAAASVRHVLRNHAYVGTAYTNRTRMAPARRRRSPLAPLGYGQGQVLRPEAEWIAVPVPALVSAEDFALVQEKLGQNQKQARRHNTRHEYLLRALVSCGACHLQSEARTLHGDYHYYACRGRYDAIRLADGRRCAARYAPAGQLDALVWADLRALLTDPAHIAAALTRAHGGAWLPQELQARRATLHDALGQLGRQQQRLLDAYLAGVLDLDTFERKRRDLAGQEAALAQQQRELAAAAQQRHDLPALAAGAEAFCAQVRDGLANATFAQRRALVELLIDRVVVTDEVVEIRYAIPTSRDGPHQPFCRLRKDYRAHVPLRETRAQLGRTAHAPPRAGRPLDLARRRGVHPAAPRPRVCPGPAPPLGTPPLAPRPDPVAGPARLFRPAGDPGHPRKPAKTRRALPRAAQRAPRAARSAPSGPQTRGLTPPATRGKTRSASIIIVASSSHGLNRKTRGSASTSVRWPDRARWCRSGTGGACSKSAGRPLWPSWLPPDRRPASFHAVLDTRRLRPSSQS